MGAVKMNSVFPGDKVFLAVVHVEDEAQAVRNSKIAYEEGADGVFLINHSVSFVTLLHCYQKVRERFPGLWIGLNCLDCGMLAVELIPRDVAGLWIDDAGIRERGELTNRAERFAADRKRSGWEGIYFGGVAFKYQREVADVAKVARLAIPFVDVITTSGAGTGKAPDVGKIEAMRSAIGTHPLAIASGITPENVKEYAPYADCFLVATGISSSHTELDPARVRAFAKAMGK